MLKVQKYLYVKFLYQVADVWDATNNIQIMWAAAQFDNF